MLRSILCADSRANNFENYTQPDFHIDYVIRRGATISSLHKFTENFLSSHTTVEERLSVKVCVGINDLLRKIQHDNGRELTIENVSVDVICARLKQFKTSIKEKRPNTLFGFITIPHFSFERYIDFSISQRKLHHSKFSDAEVSNLQETINSSVNAINNFIISENVSDISELGRPLTVQWHKEILHRHSQRTGRNKTRRIVDSYHFGRLYDGLHAKSHIKRKWFRSLCLVFERELKQSQILDCHLSSSASNYSDTVSISDSESDSEPLYSCWKRQKTCHN